jgi:hypothetical protein
MKEPKNENNKTEIINRLIIKAFCTDTLLMYEKQKIKNCRLIDIIILYSSLHNFYNVLCKIKGLFISMNSYVCFFPCF